MAAIAGIITNQTDDLRFICSMTDLLAHRGPLGDGVLWMEQDAATRITRNTPPSTAPIPGRAALGYRQMFASEGAQPLSLDAGRYWIALDGWISNADALRKELKSTAPVTTDAELVLAAYKQWGPQCLNRLEGGFAFALLDTRERKYMLARDAQGLRPCYYWATRGRIVFASEIKALFAVPEVRARLDRKTMNEFVHHGRITPGPRSHFAHIQSLPPGHYFLLPLDAPVPVKLETFSAPHAETPATTPDALMHALENALAVHRRCGSSIGVSLSGGRAGLAITAMMQRHPDGSSAQLQTFSALTEQEGPEHRTQIHASNTALHTLSNAILPTLHDFMEELDTLLWYHDEPFADASVYGQWCVARAANEAKITMLLDGYGMHGLFALPPTRSLLTRLLGTHLSAEQRALARLAPQAPQSHEPAYWPPLQTSDRNGMAFSVEIRHPFLEHPLHALAAGLTVGQKEHAEWLMHALAPALPTSLPARAPSPPFALPLFDWMRQAILPAFLRDIKLSRLPIVPAVHGGELRELVTRQIDRPDPALMPLLFRLFIANRWMQRFNVAPVI